MAGASSSYRQLIVVLRTARRTLLSVCTAPHQLHKSVHSANADRDLLSLSPLLGLHTVRACARIPPDPRWQGRDGVSREQLLPS